MHLPRSLFTAVTSHFFLIFHHWLLSLQYTFPLTRVQLHASCNEIEHYLVFYFITCSWRVHLESMTCQWRVHRSSMICFWFVSTKSARFLTTQVKYATSGLTLQQYLSLASRRATSPAPFARSTPPTQDGAAECNHIPTDVIVPRRLHPTIRFSCSFSLLAIPPILFFCGSSLFFC